FLLPWSRRPPRPTLFPYTPLFRSTLPDHVEWLAQQDAADRPHLLVLDLAVERGPSVDPATVESIVRGGTQVLVLSAMAHPPLVRDRKSTRLNSSHVKISYAVFCLK